MQPAATAHWFGKTGAGAPVPAGEPASGPNATDAAEAAAVRSA